MIIEEDLKCFLDGRALCIVGKDFINLQESKAIFITLSEAQRTSIWRLNNEARIKRLEQETYMEIGNNIIYALLLGLAGAFLLIMWASRF